MAGGGEGFCYLTHCSPDTGRNRSPGKHNRDAAVFGQAASDSCICKALCAGGSWKGSPATNSIGSGFLRHPLLSAGHLKLSLVWCDAPGPLLPEVLGDAGAGKQVQERLHSSLSGGIASTEGRGGRSRALEAQQPGTTGPL